MYFTSIISNVDTAYYNMNGSWDTFKVFLAL